MSKLIDKLNQAAKVVPQSMGFMIAHTVKVKPKMLLIASLSQANNIDNLADYITGADAVLLPVAKSSRGAKTIPKIAPSAPDIPWGGWLGDIDRRGIRPIVEGGYDFMVFPATTALAIPLDDGEIGKILQVEASLNEGLLKAVNELPIDAVLIADKQEEEYFLTWHHLMLFQRFADLLTKPLLVSIPLNVTANELQVLWETGVDGVVAEVGAGQPAGRLKKLRQTIDKLIFSPRKRGKIEALLPHIGEEISTVTEEEEEGEEEE